MAPTAPPGLTTSAALGAGSPRIRTVARRPRDVSQFKRQHAERRDKFTAALDDLASDCDSKGLADAAEGIRRLAEPVDTAELRMAPLPHAVLEPISHDLPADERLWRTQLRFQQESYAKDLYLLSRTAQLSGHISFAFDLVREAAFNHPDHKAARRVLGFVQSGDEWLSSFEDKMQKDKKVWHDEFGWIPREHVERYERGERYYKGKTGAAQWMSAAKEAELHRKFSNAWEIRTEHYLVKTNHSLERGVQIAKKLEGVHSLFFQLMAGFFNAPEQVRKLYEGSSAKLPPMPKANVVHYYRERQEYLDTLKLLTDQPIEITRGMYFPRGGIAYFFFDPNANDDSTLYHEATHQLLSGSRPKTGDVGIKNSFWIIEGIACYMESFHRDGDRFSVGDPRHERIQSARYHLIDEHYYVPFREFARMGMVAFQGIPTPRIGKNYSQGAALTHFFMHYDDGRYREALIEHLSQVYSPTKFVREAPESLEDLTGTEAEELDQQYAEYIRNLTLEPPPRPSRESAGVGK